MAISRPETVVMVVKSVALIPNRRLLSNRDVDNAPTTPREIDSRFVQPGDGGGHAYEPSQSAICRNQSNASAHRRQRHTFDGQLRGQG
jgi:hypothetical protein